MGDSLPAKLVVATRQQLHDMFLLWMQVAQQSAAIVNGQPATPFDGRPGSQADQDANVLSDIGTFILSQAVTLANSVSPSDATGSAVDTWLRLSGTSRGGPVGGSGAVFVQATSAGADIQETDVLTHLPTGLRFQVAKTANYANGAQVPITGIDTGPQTNLPAGTILQLLTSRPGLASLQVTIVQQADGSGLKGGTNQESDQEALARLQQLRSEPAASGNDAQYRKAVQEILGIGIQQGFTYSDIMGPGTIGIAFTLRPGTPGGVRIPTPEQMATVLSMVGGEMPATDGIYMISIVPFAVNPALGVIWRQGVPGWVDTTPFPVFHQGALVAASPNAAGILSAVTFRLSSPAMTEVPQVGQSVAFFDKSNPTAPAFRRKKIRSVTAISATQYDITVDTTNGVSDTSYTPANGQPCSPWSDSLDTLSPSVLAYFDALGPGEMVSSFFDPGLRQRRSPASPTFWPSAITHRLLGGTTVPQPPQGPQQNQPPVPVLYNLASLYDIDLLDPPVPFNAPVGIPGVSANLPTLGSILAFPET